MVDDIIVSMSKETTIDDLAQMVAKGFDGVDKRFDDVASKDDIKRLDTRLDHIENLLIRAHDNRIEKLEDKMRIVETAIGM